jgi:Uma2 family endonuclease
MEVEVHTKRFTVDEYHRMGQAGVFHPEARLELIEGEIVEMSPVGTRHIACVNRANALFAERLAGLAMVSVQNPVVLSDITEPQPDLLLAFPREDFYSTERVGAGHAILAVEVSDSTIRYDRYRKAPLYARAGVAELWIENLKDDVILVHRDPSPEGYRLVAEHRRGQEISIAAFPEIGFRVDELLG